MFMKNSGDLIMASKSVERIRSFYSTWIDHCENKLRKSMSKALEKGNLPTEEATSIMKNTVNIMRRTLYEQIAEQKDTIVIAMLQFAEDKRNGTAFSLNLDLMYDALTSIETAIKQAVTDYLGNEQKRFEEKSPMWSWCNYVEHATAGSVPTVAEYFQEAIKKSLTGKKQDRQDQDLSL